MKKKKRGKKSAKPYLLLTVGVLFLGAVLFALQKPKPVFADELRFPVGKEVSLGEIVVSVRHGSLAEPERQDYIACGKMAAAYCREKGYPLLDVFSVSDVPLYTDAEALADRILALYSGGGIGRVLFVWGEGVNALRQEPRQLELLPGEGGSRAGDLLWIPDQETATKGLAEFCLRAQIYSLLLRGATGVQGATLVSMRSAYDNGKKTAAALETAINRQRQTQVTSGVIETSSGYGPWREG